VDGRLLAVPTKENQRRRILEPEGKGFMTEKGKLQ
jgi:hypothetical protein